MPAPPDAVRSALNRVVASAQFRNSDSLVKLLRYTAEAALASETAAVKEYTIAVEALGRPASFDPREDSIVRVLARKLREKLGEYYAQEGQNDTIRFEYTRGSYVPRIDVTRQEAARGAAEPRARTVAVLPFLNISADHEAGYFSDGLTEELMFLLSRTPNLRVVARTSCFRFKGSTEDVREIGRQLGAELLVEGGVRCAGERLRVTARLVSAADGLEIWSDRYDRTLDDMLRVQEEIARAMAGALMLQSGPPGPNAGLEAHNLYLKGRYFWNQRTEDGFRRALEFFEAAVDRDPAMARASAGIAETKFLMMMHGLAEPLSAVPHARDAATKALEADPQLAAARSSLAAVRAWEQDFSAAEAEWQRALDCDPAYATAHHWYAMFGLVPERRFGEALRLIREAERLDPLSLPIANDVGFVLYWAGRHEDALVQCRKALSLNPLFYRAEILRGRIYAATGRYTEGIQACLAARRMCDGKAFLAQLLGTLGFCYAASGDAERARVVLDELHAIAPVSSAAEYEMGIVHTGLGHWPEARACVEAARARRTGWMNWFGVEPLYERLRVKAKEAHAGPDVLQLQEGS